MSEDQDTRTRLLNTASDLFAEHGFDGTSVRMIADEAGANLAAVNYYFGSKDNLFREVARTKLETVRAIADSARNSPGDFGDRLRVLVRGLVEAFWERRRWVRIIADDMLHGAERLPLAVREELPRNVAALSSFLAEGLDDESHPGVEPRLTAMSLVGAIIHLVVFGEFFGKFVGLDFSDQAVRETFADHHSRLMLHGLRPSAGERGTPRAPKG